MVLAQKIASDQGVVGGKKFRRRRIEKVNIPKKTIVTDQVGVDKPGRWTGSDVNVWSSMPFHLFRQPPPGPSTSSGSIDAACSAIAAEKNSTSAILEEMYGLACM